MTGVHFGLVLGDEPNVSHFVKRGKKESAWNYIFREKRFRTQDDAPHAQMPRFPATPPANEPPRRKPKAKRTLSPPIDTRCVSRPASGPVLGSVSRTKPPDKNNPP